eukprot:s908_g1.t1
MRGRCWRAAVALGLLALWRAAPCWQGVRTSRVARRALRANPEGWKCVSGCGACCYLASEDRPFLEDLLGEERMKTFRSILGEDGWCRHFDHATRSCTIYEERPDFCRVKEFLCGNAEFFGVDGSNGRALGGFCADSCRQNIAEIYGSGSEEMSRFDEEVPVYLEAILKENEELDSSWDQEDDTSVPAGWQEDPEWGALEEPQGEALPDGPQS